MAFGFRFESPLTARKREAEEEKTRLHGEIGAFKRHAQDFMKQRAETEKAKFAEAVGPVIRGAEKARVESIEQEKQRFQHTVETYQSRQDEKRKFQELIARPQAI